MTEANTEKAILAAAAGMIALLAAFFAGYVWVAAALANNFAFFDTPDTSASENLLAHAVAFAFLAAGGMLPARVLGADWLLATVAPVVASFITTLIVAASEFSASGISFGIIATPSLLAFIVSIKTGGDAVAIPAIIFSTGLLTITGVAALSAEVFGLAALISLSGWIVLPAIAGLFQPREDERTP